MIYPQQMRQLELKAMDCVHELADLGYTPEQIADRLQAARIGDFSWRGSDPAHYWWAEVSRR